MRKLIVFGALLALAAALIGCGKDVERKVAGATQALEEEEGDKAKAAVESSRDENAIKRLGE